jgi:hypothetical protein
MKGILFITIIGFLFSCSLTNKHKKDLSSSTDNYKKLDTLVSFSGSWLSEDYFNEIVKNKSPRKAQDGALFIVIPQKTLSLTTIIYNFHEGGTLLEVVSNKNNYEIWEVQNDSLSQKVYDVKILSPLKISLGDKSFVKISSDTDTENFIVLDEILFKGNYTDTKNNKIEFKSNGQIVGMDSFNFYESVIDYYDEGMQVDQIRLGDSRDKLDYYGFKFKGDTLNLYKLNCLEFDSTSNNCGVVEYGQLIYKLWKQK